MKNRKGYTLIEIVVVFAVSLILISAITLGVVEYSNYAHFKKVNNYAQRLYNVAQLQLTSYSQMGQLEDLQNVVEDNILDINTITDSEGNAVTKSNVWHGATKSIYQGTIRYLKATASDYKRYLEDDLTTSTKDKQIKALYDMFDTYLYDKTILNATICVEFDPYEGLVYAVLYSDKAQQFTYANGSGNKLVNICNRTKEVRKPHMVGYFGVDTLSKSTSTDTQKPVIKDVVLNNSETLNLSFKLGKVTEALELLNYEIVVYSDETKEPILSVLFNDETLCEDSHVDTGNYKLVSNTATTKTFTVEGKVKLYDSNAKIDGKIYTFPAWIDENGEITFVLDAVDMGATAYDMAASNVYKAMKNTFSLHRFNIDPENIYCTIQGSGNGYKTTAKKQSNVENAYFGKYSEEVTTGRETYTIFNCRHLYNVRFAEEKSKNAQKIDYKLSADFSWKDMLEDGVVYKNQDDVTKNGHAWNVESTSIFGSEASTATRNQNKGQFVNSDLVITTDSSKIDQDFPSISELRRTSTLSSLGAKEFTISDLSISKERNDRDIEALEDEYGNDFFSHLYRDLIKRIFGIDIGNNNAKTASAGLFLTNNGTIHNICLDKITVDGKDSVGSVCGINGDKGTLNDIIVYNTDKKSVINGTGSNVGGLCGSQTNTDREYSQLTNRATVIGEENVGGIIGSLQTGARSISVDRCRNYGQIKAASKDTENVGGILGWAYVYKNSSGVIRINNCIGSPRYALSEITIDNGLSIKVDLYGNKVGGIVGYNQGADISGCSTIGENGTSGYIIGNKYVGGIVGCNDVAYEKGLDGENKKNQANVIGNSYVGGIAGVNAAFSAGKVTNSYNEKALIRNWTNEGLALSLGDYCGGITGYNAGIIEQCKNAVNYTTQVATLSKIDNASGNCIGGVVGYNNGMIKGTTGKTISVVSVVSGNNYVGGIVGYNDNGAYAHVKDYKLQGGYIKGNTFVGGYVGLNTNVNFIKEDNSTLMVSNPNKVTGNYCVGGVVGGNIFATDTDVSTTFKSYNIVGAVSGKQFVGGVIGYSKFIDSNKTYSWFETNVTNDIKDYVLNSSGGSSKKAFTINGDSVELRSITADTYVGGVIGYNDANTFLYVKDMTNKTPITAKDCKADKLQGNSDTNKYAYVGGVTGRITQNIIIDNCKNSGLGNIISKGTYKGGIAEINEGLVVNCQTTNFGTSKTDNVGGIIGLNLGTGNSSFGQGNFVATALGSKPYVVGNSISKGIYDCTLKGTVTGRNCVGGIVSVNRGKIHTPNVNGKIAGYGTNVGGIAGENYGKIELDKTIDVGISGVGTNVGGIVGTNYKDISIKEGADAQSMTTAKNKAISGKTCIGGIIGKQAGDGNVIGGFVNGASVTASDGNAGGIVGSIELDTGNTATIEKCVNLGTIQATRTGNAGGIAAVNDGSILDCWNGGNVSAANGMCGGIAGVNYNSISKCNISNYISNSIESDYQGNYWSYIRNLHEVDGDLDRIRTILGSAEGSITISGKEQVGAISAINEGTVDRCTVASTSAINFTNSGDGCAIGGLVGLNKEGGTILLGDYATSSVFVSTYSNDCDLGGVAGTNNGTIRSAANTMENSNVSGKVFFESSANRGNLGGVAGTNNGDIENCHAFAKVTGDAGDSTTPVTGCGGVVGVNRGSAVGCAFDGDVYTNGNSSFITCIGGISGINAGTLEDCVVGEDGNDHTTIQNGKSNAAYGYVGGLVGYNKGTINTCDNGSKAHDNVYILNYAGHTGGLIGRNYNKAVVKGEAGSPTSTGKKWTVLVRYYDNDCGAGGVMGYNASGENISYVDNNADVYYTAKASNTSTGGMIGRLENSEETNLLFSNCNNYGAINGAGGVLGGYIGTLKYNGATFKNCENQGDICRANNKTVNYYTVDSNESLSLVFTANVGNAGGFIGRIYSLSNDSGIAGMNRVTFTNCKNSGDVKGTASAGFVAFSSQTTSLVLSLSDCVNTGCIYGGNASGMVTAITGASKIYMYRCRNYGLCDGSNSNIKESFTGLYKGNGENAYKSFVDCLDCSNASKYPITTAVNKPEFIDNYYVVPGKTVETTLVEKGAKIVAHTVEGNKAYSEQANNPTSKMYDGNPTVASGDSSSGRITCNDNKWAGKNLDLVFSVDPNELKKLDNISIRWGNNGDDKTLRKYKYRLYYQLENSSQWNEVTSSFAGDNELPSAEYQSGTGLNYYEAIGYTTKSASAASTYKHKLNLNDVDKVAKIKISVLGVTTSTNGTTWSDNQYVIIGEVFPYYMAESSVVSGGEEYTASVGTPASLVGEAGNYTIRGANTSTGDVMLLENIACSGDDKANYRTDYTKDGYRKNLYTEIEKALETRYQQKYDTFAGDITVGDPVNKGNNTYALQWSSTQSAYAYEVSYKITDDSGTVLAIGSNVQRTNENSTLMQIPTSYLGKKVTFGVRAIYYSEGQEKYSDWSYASTIGVKKNLPAPLIHLEMVKVGDKTNPDDAYKFKVVLDNADDYQEYTPDNIQIQVTGAGNVTFNASDKESLTYMTNMNNGNISLEYKAVDTQGKYDSSEKRTVMTKGFAPSTLSNTDFVWTKFNGFQGKDLAGMNYSVSMEKVSGTESETYFAIELLNYDDTLNNIVAVSSGESHVTTYGQTMTASLANIPEDFIEEMIKHPDKELEVRTYPWRTQAYMIYFGHTLKANLTKDEVIELEESGNCPAFDGDGKLKDGYVIKRNSDETYNIIYSIILDNDDTFRNQVDSLTYHAEKRDGKYYLVDSRNISIPIEDSPVIDTAYDYNKAEESYQFQWDNGLAKPTSQLYRVTLTGLSDPNVEIDSRSLSGQNATFIDDNWSYANIRLAVERVGETDAGGATVILPRKSTKDYNLKLRLDQISAPVVNLHEENGQVQKNDATYDVEWEGLTKEPQRDELKCYEITFRHADEETGLVTEAIFNTNESTGEIHTYNPLTKVTEDTGERPSITNATAKGESATVDLNYFIDSAYDGKDFDISIRGISADNSTTYRNGAEGVKTTISLPSRVGTPVLSNLHCETEDLLGDDDYVTVERYEETGFKFSMAQEYEGQSGQYQMVYQIVDKDGNKLTDLMLGEEAVGKTNPVTMSGSFDDSQYTLTVPSQYAGQYLRVVMRAIADSDISSRWTDVDGVSSNLYKDFKLPKVQLDAPNLIESAEDVTYKHDSESSADWDELSQTTVEFEPIEFAGRYKINIVGTAKDVYIFEDQNHKRSEIYSLILKKVDDETYDVSCIFSLNGEEQEKADLDQINAENTSTEIPFKVTLGSSLAEINMVATLSFENGRFKLLLPDSPTDNARSTRNITVQAMPADEENYVPSNIGSWYRSEINLAPVTGINVIDVDDDDLKAPKLKREQLTIKNPLMDNYDIQMTLNKPYRLVFEVSAGLNGEEEPEFKKFYSLAGNEITSTNFSSILLLDKDTWHDYLGTTVSVRMRYIIPGKGLGSWSEPVQFILEED